MKKILGSILLVMVIVFSTKEGEAGQKVTICHNNHEITISINALPAHIAHGDMIGGCQPVLIGVNEGEVEVPL